VSLSILLADDHGVLRAGLRALLGAEVGLDVVGEATSGDETVELAAELLPDIVLLDLNMPGPGGIEVARRLAQAVPDTRVLVLTVHEDEALVREAIDTGASGYIIKRAVESELINAIHAVARGELYVHPSMTRALLPEPARPNPAHPTGEEPLTPREKDVLHLIVHGYTNRQAADELGLSVRTVETHRANLMGKLGLRSRVELVRWAADRDMM
jgi:DNA-binding NarL/FixJ family response regulator